MPGARRLLAAAGAVALLGLVAALGVSSPASAHNVLRSTAPADGSTVDAPPEAVTLVFDEPAIAMGSVVEVTDPGGQVVSDGPVQLRDTSVVQPVAADVGGTYRVVWRITSGDGHPIEGTFAFTAITGADAPASASGESTTVVAEPSGAPPVRAAEGSPWPWVAGVLGVVVAAAGVGLVLLRRRRPGARTG